MQTISDEVAEIPMTSGRLRFWAAGAVLLAGLLATGLVARSAKYAVDNAEKEDFNFACGEIRSKIVERFRAHEQILRSASAFLAHSVGVNRQAWRFFTENQQLETQLPGIQGIGFSLLIPRAKLAQHIQEIRAEGFPNYDVFPKGDRELYSSIIYLEPFTSRNLRAFGYDMLSEPVRREAMERARDENTAALSGKVTLVQETGQEVQAGTLMYVPFYRRDLPHETIPQRRAVILGWAYSPYRMNDLLGGILGTWGQPSQKRIRLEIFDGDQVADQTRLYDSQAARSEQPGPATDALLSVQSRIVLAGRPWALCFTRTGSQAGTVDYSKVRLVGFGGGSLSLFLAALTFLLLSSLGRAQQLALELKQSEEHYRTMLDGSPHAVFLTDESGRIRMANQVAATLAGHKTAQDLVGGLLADLVQPAQRADVQAAIQTILRQGFATPLGCAIPHRDGTVAYAELSGTLVKDFQGLPQAVQAILQDVTERERVSVTLRLQATLLENLSEGIYIIGLDDLLIKWANPIFERMFGYEAGEILGMHVDQVNAPTTRTAAETRAAIRERLQATGHWHGEVENRKKDGSRFWCHANASLFDHAQFGKVILAAHTDITARKLIEEKLRISEERHRIHAHYAIDNIWTMGIDRTFTYFSPSIERLVGFTPAEYLALPLAEMLTADSLAIAMKYLDNMAAAAQAGIPAEDFRGEMELKRKNGSTIWAEITASWIYDSEGKIVELFGITRDISARKQMEGELRKTKERLEATLSALPDLMFRVDQKGCIHECHTAATEKLFVSPSLFLGKKFTEVIPEKAADTIMAAIESARIHGSHQGATYSLPLPEGVAWFELSIAAMRGTAEKDSQFILLARDITARKQMEEKLRISEEQYRLLAENISDVIWILDLDSGSFRYISPSVERLRGYTVEEARAQDMRQSITQDSWARLQNKLSERMQAYREGCHQVYTDELEQSCKNGSTVWAETSTRFVLNETNGHLEVYGVSRNISERKRFEAEKEQLQAQASQLQKAESLNRMAGAIAHHFNNQLGAATLCLDLAMHDPAGDLRPIAALQDALASVREAAKVSTLMLTYLGQIPIELQPLDLAQTCQQNLPHLQKLLPQGVEMQTNFPSAGPVIDSSASQVKQILINLITNAYEACGDRGGKIQLTVTTMARADIAVAHRFPVDSQPTASAYACLEVADNGCGIPAQDIDKIFDPFFSTKFTGRGLGLPVVLGIARSHLGFATVESQFGGWSVFRVFLPLSVKAIPAKPALPIRALKVAKGEAVLLAEDDSSLRSVVARALKRFGYDVYEAQDGVEAVELFKQHQEEIICVLSDLTMPRMDGWETISAIRQISPGTPIILSSGYNESRAMAGGHGEQPQAFLSKPYDFEELKETLDRVLKSGE